MAGEMALSADTILNLAAAAAAGFLAGLVVARRPRRRCPHCRTTLLDACTDKAACNRRAEERELQSAGN